MAHGNDLLPNDGTAGGKAFIERNAVWADGSDVKVNAGQDDTTAFNWPKEYVSITHLSGSDY